MNKTTQTPIILASGSPRRRELVQLLDWQVTIAPADIDESVAPGETATHYVTRMAKEKAIAAAAQASSQAIIIAADTTVADGTQIMGKPQSEAQARAMLRQLRNRTHRVLTALTITHQGQTETICVASDVPMRNYSDAEIEAYIASGDPFDKAGGYAIQHEGFHPVENFQDCYANVMGLPVCDLAVLGKKFNLPLPTDLPERCQKYNCYHCSCYATHLRGTYE